jgi:hypothetical protein
MGPTMQPVPSEVDEQGRAEEPEKRHHENKKRCTLLCSRLPTCYNHPVTPMMFSVAQVSQRTSCWFPTEGTDSKHGIQLRLVNAPYRA